MFWCLPDKSKCEWKKLKKFINLYNNTFQTEYVLEKCLDVFDSTKPQPEIRLKSPKNKDIVIEHKIITWPPDYIKRHQAQHDFFDSFSKELNQKFQDDVYVLELSEKELVINKNTLKQLAYKLANTIIKNKELIKSKGGIGSSQPIKWQFRRLSENELNDDVPVRGIGMYLIKPDSFNNFESEHKKAIEGIKRIIISHLEKVSIKFQGYADYLKIFITELYGDNDFFDHELIEKISVTIAIPLNIDQIWIGYPAWVTAYDYEIAYKQIKIN